METLITLVAALVLLTPFVVLVLRTTRWDPVEHRRRRTATRPSDPDALADWGTDDVRRASIDLAEGRAFRLRAH